MIRRKKNQESSLTFPLKYTDPHYVEDDAFLLEENTIYNVL